MLVTETLVLETEQYSFSSTFYEQLLSRYSFAKKLQSQMVTRENNKVAGKMLMKLTPGPNLKKKFGAYF